MERRLTITEAAKAWNTHHDTVRQWIRSGRIEAQKGNSGVWYINPGQQPPPYTPRTRAQDDVPSSPWITPGATPGEQPRESSQVTPGDGNELMTARMEAAVARREIELLREAQGEALRRYQERVDELSAALAAAQDEAKALASELRDMDAASAAERARLLELMRQALDRPTWLERALRALRG